MKELFNSYVQSLETYIMFKIGEEVTRITPELEAKGRSPIKLSIGAPVANPPEFVTNKLKEALDIKGIHSYSSPRGEKYYLEAISRRMKERFGVEVNPKDEIFSLIGSKEGLANIIRELINATEKEDEKDIILIPNPGYASYKEMIKVSGGLGYSIPLTFENNYMPNLDEVWSNLIKDGFNPKKVKALIVNYPNNPLGATATLDYYKEVIAFCKKYNILCISDAAYTDMYFTQEVPPSILQVESAKDIAVEFFSFSKPYAMTGWRLGWICGNKEVVEIFGKQKTTIDTGLFKALQKAASEVLNSKEGEDYIKCANKGFKKNQDIFLEGLKELGWDTNSFKIPSATFYLWLPIPPRYKTAEEFTNDLMYKSGIVAIPGPAFGDFGEGYFRVSLVCSEEGLLEAIDRMKKDGFYYNK